MNPLKPSGYFMFTTFNTKDLHVRLTERIYDLLGSSNRQHYILGNYLIGSYNRDGICLL